MKVKDLAALLVTGEENVTYFTGSRSSAPWLSFTRPRFAIVPVDGDPILVVHIANLGLVKSETIVRDVRTYEASEKVPLGNSPVEMLSDLFKEMGLSKARVGTELGLEQRLGFPCGDFLRLKLSLPDADFIDASDLLWGLRIVKSKEEIRYIRKACEITAKAREKCFETINRGMTKKQVANLFFQYMLEGGADKPTFVMLAFGSLAKSTYAPTKQKLRKGDTLFLDGGCNVGDYTCDFDRIATVGKPSEKQVKLHNFAYMTSRKMIAEFKPGARLADIAEICQKEYEKVGVPITKAGRAGHGQGMLHTEPPSVSKLDSTILEPGMVISAEPGLDTDLGLFVWEDVLAITENGHQFLSKENPELVVI
jgi:Xaa-Pro aminopeptidase